MEIQDDQLFCDCYGKKVIVNRYENYEIFINHCAKVLGIENILNKIQWYIKLNDDIDLEIMNQKMYKEYILDDFTINNVFCVIKDSNIEKEYKKKLENENKDYNKSDLINKIINLENTINFLNVDKNEILKKNRELEFKFLNLKKKYADYIKDALFKIKQLEKEIKQLLPNDYNDLVYNSIFTFGNGIKTNDMFSENSIQQLNTNDLNLQNEKNIYSFNYTLNSYELKSNSSQNKKYIKAIIQIENNGKFPLPKNCLIMNKPNDDLSDFTFKETNINKNNEIKPNQKVRFAIDLIFKSNEIKNKDLKVYFVLYHSRLGIIGKERIIHLSLT